MKTADFFLDRVKEKHNLASDYKLAQFLGWNQQRVSKIRNGTSFDDDASAQIAHALGLEPSYVAACMAAQRAKSPEARRMWEKAAKALAGSAVAVLVGCASIGPDALDISIFGRTDAAPNIHYAQSGPLGLFAKSALCALILLQLMRWTRTCSARWPSRTPI